MEEGANWSSVRRWIEGNPAGSEGLSYLNIGKNHYILSGNPNYKLQTTNYKKDPNRKLQQDLQRISGSNYKKTQIPRPPDGTFGSAWNLFVV